MPENANPLNKYFRQPAVFVTLPSGGNYPPHVLTQSQTGEIGVQPMTARDEIIFKTPDALMNGQGMVDVIQSCIPEIKDAWQISNYDLDTILIAIRIATYGETMDINFNVPGTTEKASHTLNLPSLLEQIKTTEVNNDIELKDGLKIAVRPLTYKDMTSTALKTFTQQKLYSTVQNTDLAPEEKVKRFKGKRDRYLYELIPEKMQELGVDKVEVDGNAVSLITFVNGTMPKDPLQKQAAMAHLRDIGCSDFIKNTLTCQFGRSRDNEAKAIKADLEEAGLYPELGEKVEPSTLKKLIKDRLQNGQEIDTEMFNASVGQIAKLS